MLDFFERNWRSLVFIVGGALFVRYLVNKERKEEEKKQGKNIQKKTKENQKDIK